MIPLFCRYPLDLIQLYSATQRVVQSLKTSGLMPALKTYRASLHGQNASGNGKIDRAGAESVLMQASTAYIEKSAMFGDDEVAVINLLHLRQLGSDSFWLDMISNVRSIEVRQAQAVSAYSKIMFASSHLPGLLSLVRETTAVEGLRTDEVDAGTLVLRLYDSIEPASSPDRMSRLIDAIDMIYSACSSLSDAPASSIRLMSVSGVAVRSVIFHGDLQTINTTQKVVANLNRKAAESFENNSYSVEAIASEMPFLDAIAELEQIDVLDAGLAAKAGREAQEGAIMLLECGAQLVDYTSVSDTGYIPASVIAKLDADGRTFDNIDFGIGESIDARYDEVYEREKDRLLNETTLLTEESATEDTASATMRSERNVSASVVIPEDMDIRKDSIDELIMDLNRLYGEQR